MVNKEILTFLKQLKENNNRDWFNAHKERYKKVNQEFHLLVNQIISIIKRFDESLGLLNAKECMFRIYRDVRFSPDKSPYKTHFGAFIAPGGRKSIKPGYYFHLEPGGTLLAGGVWQPPADVLKHIRQDIYNQIDEFKSIIESNCFKGHFKEFYDPYKLKMPPKGFPKDFPDIDLLKHKNYTVSKTIPDDVVLSDRFSTEIEEVYRCLHRFNEFMDQSIDSMGNE